MREPEEGRLTLLTAVHWDGMNFTAPVSCVLLSAAELECSSLVPVFSAPLSVSHTQKTAKLPGWFPSPSLVTAPRVPTVFSHNTFSGGTQKNEFAMGTFRDTSPERFFLEWNRTSFYCSHHLPERASHAETQNKGLCCRFHKEDQRFCVCVCCLVVLR
nr:uncharacterized protein LOC105499144 isoform X2 [Macaca nemestrina]